MMHAEIHRPSKGSDRVSTRCEQRNLGTHRHTLASQKYQTAHEHLASASYSWACFLGGDRDIVAADLCDAKCGRL